MKRLHAALIPTGIDFLQKSVGGETPAAGTKELSASEDIEI
jgi:hypothetical protein